MKELESEFKKNRRKNIEQYKERKEEILKEEKEKINLLIKDIEKMNEIIKNDYIPIPDYIIVNEECLEEKTNEEIPENQLLITIKNLSYEKSNLKIILSIINKKKEIQCKKGNELNETFNWEFYKDTFINLFNDKLTLSLILKNSLKRKAEISLRNIKNKNKIEENINLIKNE